MTYIDNTMNGKRVRLVSMDDKYTKLRAGDTGTIKFILRQKMIEDQIAVDWDNGERLFLLAGIDKYEIIS
jgi:hypothetical protein